MLQRRLICGRALTKRLPSCARHCILRLENRIASGKDANESCWYRSRFSMFLTRQFDHDHMIFVNQSSSALKGTSFPNAHDMNHASLWHTARSCSSTSDAKELRSQTKNERMANDSSLHTENKEEEEREGFAADMQVSPVSKELQQAQQVMITSMRRCSYILFAVGGTHFVWGGMMFLNLETPLNHVVMTGVFLSSVVFCGLAYHIRQGSKPVQLFSDLFFVNMDEYHDMRVVFLSRKITRMLGAVFYRGRGIAFVLSVTLAAHVLSCLTLVL